MLQGAWKFVSDGGAWQLYNLARDIGEAKDVAPEKQFVETRLGTEEKTNLGGYEGIQFRIFPHLSDSPK